MQRWEPLLYQPTPGAGVVIRLPPLLPRQAFHNSASPPQRCQLTLMAAFCLWLLMGAGDSLPSFLADMQALCRMGPQPLDDKEIANGFVLY